MKINPILVKEMKVRSRSMRIPIVVMMYVVLLAFVAVFMMISSVEDLGNGGGVQYYNMNYLFSALGYIQCIMSCMVTLVTAACSFTAEKERGTLDILLMTPVRSWEVINGKLFAVTLNGCLFSFASMPVLALGTIYGGVGIDDMLFLMVVIVVLCFLCGAIGIFASILSDRSSVSVVVSLILVAVLTAGCSVFSDMLVSFQGGDGVIVPVIVLGFAALNPMILFYGFYDKVTGAQLLANELIYHYNIAEGSELYLFLENHLMTCCIVCQSILILLFLWIGVWRLKRARNVT